MEPSLKKGLNAELFVLKIECLTHTHKHTQRSTYRIDQYDKKSRKQNSCILAQKSMG